MTSEDQTLLYKAAADPKGQIALKRSRCGEWHADRDQLDGLARCGHLLSLGERMGPHLGGTFAVWQITPAGRPLADRGGAAAGARRERHRRPVPWLQPASLRSATGRRASSFASTAAF